MGFEPKLESAFVQLMQPESLSLHFLSFFIVASRVDRIFYVFMSVLVLRSSELVYTFFKDFFCDAGFVTASRAGDSRVQKGRYPHLTDLAVGKPSAAYYGYIINQFCTSLQAVKASSPAFSSLLGMLGTATR